MAAQLTCVIPVFEAIMYTRVYVFATASLTVCQLADGMVPGPTSLHWHFASLPTRCTVLLPIRDDGISVESRPLGSRRWKRVGLK